MGDIMVGVGMVVEFIKGLFWHDVRHVKRKKEREREREKKECREINK